VARRSSISGKVRSPLTSDLDHFVPSLNALPVKSRETGTASCSFPNLEINHTRLTGTIREGGQKLLSTTWYLANDDLSRPNFMLAVSTPLVVINIGCTVRLGGRVEWLEVAILFLRNDQKRCAVVRIAATYGSKDMAKVPNLREGRPVVVASEVWKGTSLSLEGVLDLGQRVGSLVRGGNAVGGQQVVGGVSLETASG